MLLIWLLRVEDYLYTDSRFERNLSKDRRRVYPQKIGLKRANRKVQLRLYILWIYSLFRFSFENRFTQRIHRKNTNP